MDVKPGGETAEHDAEVQDVYARWLDAGTRVSFTVSIAAFLLYVSGTLAPQVPLERLPQLWGLPVGEFLRQTAAPSGWDWLPLIGRADYLNLACVALIALVSVLCYLRVVPLLLRLGERLQAAVAIVQVLILLAAASGLLAGGA
jgi:hypothetical protein